MGYVTVTAVFQQLDDETLAGLLDPLPVLGCQIEDAGTGVLVTVYLDERHRASLDAVGDVLAAAGGEGIEAGSLEDRDWLAGYRAGTRPFPVGRLWWLEPHPDTPAPVPPGRIRLAIEPRSAFGSGSHESTQVLLLALEEGRLDDLCVLDAGTGSGILALAANAQGAKPVVGFDIDPDALFVAAHTVKAQDWQARILLFAGTLDALDAHFDLILCNMLWSQMEPLIQGLAEHLSAPGTLLLSGLLEADDVAATHACEGAGLTVTGRRRLGEWLALEAQRG